MCRVVQLNIWKENALLEKETETLCNYLSGNVAEEKWSDKLMFTKSVCNWLFS